MSDEVQTKNTVNFGKNNCISVQAFRGHEMEIHGDLLEDGNIFDDNSSLILKVVPKCRIIKSSSPVDEQLIGLLLVHDEILARNDA